MGEAHSIQTCRWGTPTLFLPWPFWCEASDDLWSCTRGWYPRGLPDPGACAACQNWAAARASGRAAHDGDDHLGSTAS